MLVCVLRWWVRLWLKAGLFYSWSRTYRRWLCRGRTAKIPELNSTSQLTQILDDMQWKRDGWRAAFDAARDPRVTWARHLDGKPAGDCEDIALFALACLEDMAVRDKLPRTDRFLLLTVVWMSSTGKLGGHSVAVFRYQAPGELKWAHVGNWHRGKVRTGYAHVEDIVRELLGAGMCLGWSLATSRLECVAYSDGKDL